MTMASFIRPMDPHREMVVRRVVCPESNEQRRGLHWEMGKAGRFKDSDNTILFNDSGFPS